MSREQDDVQALREVVAQLTRRVYRLEQAAAAAGIELHEPPPVRPAAPQVPVPAEAPAAPSPPEVAPRARPAMSAQGLESMIGSQWLNRIGIAAVLIGASYFLKFAFDNNWIGPAGRIAIGLIAGIAVVVWSERFRARGYPGFSYSLKAVGIGVLYLSLWAGFQLYHLLPSGVAFAAMVFVTAATAFMALRQDAEILAAFALAGGFSTPLLVSTGENHQIALFSYVALLDLAAVAVVAQRPWRRLVLGAFFGTLVLYIGWYDRFYDRTQLGGTLFFASLLFAIFTVSPLLGTRAESGTGNRASPLLLVLPLLNAGVYFFQVYVMLEEIHSGATAWFALALAAVFLGLSRAASAGRGEVERRDLRLLHIALAVGFITAAIPLKLNAHWITIGWLTEAGALLWVARRTNSDLLRLFATGALALGVFRLLAIDNFYTARLLFNSRFATYAVAIAVLSLAVRYGSGREGTEEQTGRAIAVVAINLLALTALTREIADAFLRSQQGLGGDELRMHWIARDFSYSALWMAYGAALMFAGFWKRWAFLRWQALILIAVTIVKVFVYDVSQLDRVYRILSFIVLGALLLAISFAYQRDWLKLSAKSAGGASRA